jgi:hypothetical protein
MRDTNSQNFIGSILVMKNAYILIKREYSLHAYMNKTGKLLEERTLKNIEFTI